MLRLVFVSKNYLPSIKEAVEEYKNNPSKYDINAVKRMIVSYQNNFDAYLTDAQNASLGIGLKPGHVPSTLFWLVEGQTYIGTFDLRHSLTPSLIQEGGHIAYEIRPTFRRKGYALKGLRLCLDEAFKKGIKQALITCKAENTASYNTMHKAMLLFGGFEDEPCTKDSYIEKRIWVNTSNHQ